MKKAFLIFFLLTIFVFTFLKDSNADFIGVGRGEGLNGIIACFDGNQEKGRHILGEKIALFCIDRINDKKFVIGGSEKNAGTIWIVEGEKVVYKQALPESKAIYSVKVAHNGKIWAVGSHNYMGACAWIGNEKDGFKISSVLNKGSIAYAVCEDNEGKIFVGGIFYTHGKVWIYNKGRWDKGTILQDSRMVNSLCVDKKGNVIAAGQKIRHGQSASGHGTVHQGGIWIFDGKQWGAVIEIPQSVNIYCSAKDKDGNIWLGGAGKDGKVLWVSDNLLWKPISLENCFTLYSMCVDEKTGDIFVSGWNKKIWWSCWVKKYKKNWSKNEPLKKFGLIRALTYTDNCNYNK